LWFNSKFARPTRLATWLCSGERGSFRSTSPTPRGTIDGMKRRRLLLFGLLVAITLAMVGGIWWWAVWPHTAISRENAARIDKGMTRAEVEAILGGPARIEPSTGVVPDLDLNLPENDQLLRLMEEQQLALIAETRPIAERPIWVSDNVSIYVRFDDQGRVEKCLSVPVRPVQESLTDKLRRWLRL
jgi:hypothetical protein